MIGDTLRDAWLLYRLLWRRGVAVGGIVFGIIVIADVLANKAGGRGPAFATLVLSIVGVAFVQGVLVESVRNTHEGRRPASWRSLYERAGSIFPGLLVGSIVYGLCVAVGVVLLVVPGLIVLARFALFAPAIVLEGAPIGDALRRSNQVVRGRTVPVLALLVLVWAGVLVIGVALAALLGGGVLGSVVGFIWQALAAPYEAHVLTALYYRLTEPERPVVHPAALAASGSGGARS